MITKGQKTISIVNIVMGVILALSGFMMFSQPDTFPGSLIVLPLGLVFWLWGAKTLRCLRDEQEDTKSFKTTLTVNKILFIFSCVVLCSVVVLPVVAPML